MLADLARDALGLLGRRGDVAGVLDRQKAQPGAEGRSPGGRTSGSAVEPAFVDDLGDEPADVRVHAARAVEEDPPVGRHGRDARRAGARARRRRCPRDGCPGRPGRAAADRRAGRRCAPPYPSRARRRATPARPRRSPACRACRRAPRARTATRSRPAAGRPRRPSTNSSRSAMLRIEGLAYSVSPTPALDFLSPRKLTPSVSAASSISSSRLWIALWLVAATPTRRPRRMRSTTSRAPVHVLPVPGGPWMTR